MEAWQLMAEEKTKTDDAIDPSEPKPEPSKRRQDDGKFREGNKSDKRLDAVDQLLEEWEAMKKHVSFSSKKGEPSETKTETKTETKAEGEVKSEPGFLESHTSMWGL